MNESKIIESYSEGVSEIVALMKVKKADNIVDVKVEACGCGWCLSSIEGKIQTRQVFDLPKIAINVTEYRTREIVSPRCNKMHKPELFGALTGQKISQGIINL